MLAGTLIAYRIDIPKFRKHVIILHWSLQITVDATRFKTHFSLILHENWKFSVLNHYSCVLFSNAADNHKTLDRFSHAKCCECGPNVMFYMSVCRFTYCFEHFARNSVTLTSWSERMLCACVFVCFYRTGFGNSVQCNSPLHNWNFALAFSHTIVYRTRILFICTWFTHFSTTIKNGKT